ncbi:MAG: hypothetical protein DRO11_01310, partial [Methanobacteriota archaeon]
MLPGMITYIWAAFIILTVIYFISRSLLPGLFEEHKAVVGVAVLILTVFMLISPISSAPSDILLSPGVRTEPKYRVVATTQLDISDPESFEEIPLEMGSWRGQDLYGPQYVRAVESMGGELLLQRGYHNDEGVFTWLLVMYGPRSAAFHDAEACYYLTGWTILGKGVEPFRVPGTEVEMYAKRLRVMKGNQQRLLFYWTMEKPGPGGRVVGLRVGTFVSGGDWRRADQALRDLVEHIYKHLYKAGEEREILMEYLLSRYGGAAYG